MQRLVSFGLQSRMDHHLCSESCSCWVPLSIFLAKEENEESDCDSGLGDSPPPTPPAALDVVLPGMNDFQEF